jgi:hypothetical protein
MRAMTCCLLALLAVPNYPASAANPQLQALVWGIDDDETRSQSLELAELHLDMTVVGMLADATVTARFFNPSEDTLEGDFSLELPAGAVVTGYALDVEGTMLDGVLVDPLKAERAYRGLVRQNIDPGIARVSRAHVFNTRVFPIPAEDSRTIRVRFSAPVQSGKGLTLPLVTGKPLESFTFSLRACGEPGRPTLRLPNDLRVAWRRSGDCATATANLAGRALSGALNVRAGKPRVAAIATAHHGGATFMQIHDGAAPHHPKRVRGQRLRVYWDHSFSRRDQALGREKALLAAFVRHASPSQIELVSFSSRGAQARRLALSELGAAIGNLRYRGATSFAVLDTIELAPADTCLMFSDGLVTLGARGDFAAQCEMIAITSSPSADLGFLRRVAGTSGRVLNLSALTDAEAAALIRWAGPRVLAAVDEAGSSLSFASLPATERTWSVIVEAPASGNVTLRIGGVAEKPVLRTYSARPSGKVALDAPGALWAADRAALIAARDGEHDAFVALARRFSIAAPGLSFLVLEHPGDYAEVGIPPPANYPAERRAQYDEIMAEIAQAGPASEAAFLEALIGEWNSFLAWWNTPFDPAAPAKIRPSDVDPDGEMLEEVIATGLRASASPGSEAVRQVAIEMADWKVARPYVAALDAATPTEVDAVLMTQEQRYGALPMFHFDVAEWLYRRQRIEEAIDTLLSALDLPAADEDTAIMVAERLQRYGRFDDAVWLLERMARVSDYLPQPRRLLARALVRRAAARQGAAARADLVRAAELLGEVAMAPWGPEFEGIQLVALVEANTLWPRLEAVGVRDMPIHPGLRARLDFDLRVIIEWNTGATDMDLWVDEPNGERAFYSNPLTVIGGRLSNDMVSGWGPEEYLLRRAAKGEYRISVNAYAPDVINPNGSTVVTARLFRHFGKPFEVEQSMEIELEPGEDGEKLIGTFTVK